MVISRWSVGVPSISRKTNKGLPRYDDANDSDTFVLTGFEDLVPLLEEVAGDWREPSYPDRNDNGVSYRIRRYRPRLEGAFARIERWQAVDSGELHWRVTTRDNVTTIYGRSPQARIADPRKPARVFEWLAELSYDDKGNCIRYEYKGEDTIGVDVRQPHEKNRISGLAPITNRYLKRALYCIKTHYHPSDPEPTDFHFQTVFDYGEHQPDHQRRPNSAPGSCVTIPSPTTAPASRFAPTAAARASYCFMSSTSSAPSRNSSAL